MPAPDRKTKEVGGRGGADGDTAAVQREERGSWAEPRESHVSAEGGWPLQQQPEEHQWRSEQHLFICFLF